MNTCTSERTKTHIVRTLLLCVVMLMPQLAIAADNTEKNGDNLQFLILAMGLGGTLFYEEGHQGSIQFIQSFVSSQIITEGLKLAIDKERPNGNCCNSFPSGHASKAFMGAGFIHKRYGLGYGMPAISAQLMSLIVVCMRINIILKTYSQVQR